MYQLRLNARVAFRVRHRDRSADRVPLLEQISGCQLPARDKTITVEMKIDQRQS
jgi:hypothetical protein